ncbi:uncharacterized protein P884DRAFT_196243 [Thermothelomyces heterothallicus CBS 202.75]|uniref:uncharacterized protein n=1 Tax=Thermothelomyces heterothallicus CBS 202.75 TaxID=1149848 RepID=UPI00374492E7
MNDSPSARTPGLSAPSRGRRLRSTSESSPTRQRNTDDLLSNLTPRTVVDAFRNPSGSLKACIEAATPAEQAFALRVAMASNTIHEWLTELSSWPWPAGGGSAGFEMPADKRKAIPGLGKSQASDQEYNGSLPAADVARYEKRIDEIAQGLEELNIEEIKSQVLNNHIMPLSRPGTPVIDSGRSAMSLSSITRLDDLTALVTVTTLQALPELSRLTRLMNAWSLRLLVLRKIPVFLASVSDAEAALQSGWNALGPDGRIESGSTGAPSAVSPLDDLEVMKSVIGQKVAKAGRDLDAMLDILEGQPDTLPEDWIDRVDTLEHGYGEWTVACDRKMKHTDLISSIVQAAPATGACVQPQHSVAANRSLASDSLEREQTQVPEGERPDGAQKPDSRPDVSPPVIKIHSTTADQTQTPEDDYPDTDSELVQSASDGSSGAGPHTVLASKPSKAHHNHEARPEDAPGSSFSSDSELSDISGHGAPQPAQRGRRASGVSESSTVLNEAPSMFMDSFSSDLLDQGVSDSFDHGRVDRGEGPNRSLLSTRSRSVSFNDHPTVTELPSFPSPPGTPTTSTTLDDDDATEPGTPSERQMPGVDDQLQQQISEILESVPAKIRLTAEPPAVNLNPPDFKMPTARKSSRSDAIPRSQSNGSMRSVYSRSATPSFTLAPARNSRPRHQRDNREIKVYHLSRSNGEAPIKLFIRCVGEHGERVMVRVGGGWADLGEYLKEYASHHLRRSAGAAADGKVEVKDIPRTGSVRPPDATPPSRPASAMDAHSPVSPLKVRKTRRSPTANSDEQNRQQLPAATRPKTPLANLGRLDATPPSDASSSMRSRSSSRISWEEDDGTVALGMAGPRAKQIEMSEESRAWVESIKEKVRIASIERKPPPPPPPPPSSSFSSVPSIAGAEGGAAAGGVKGLEASLMDRGDVSGRAMFGELGKVGSTKRLFRRV